MHILVTGSSGTIGTRLSETLLQGAHTVTGMDWQECVWSKTVNELTLQVDLRDDMATKKAGRNLKSVPDVLVHLAANARVYELVEHPDRARDNFITLWSALELCRTLKIPHFIFASSREGYGNINVNTFKEDMVRVENCESPYTASKVGGEALVEAYRRCYGIQTTILRFSNVYGMYDNSVRVVPLFLRLARKNEPMTVFGKEKCLDFTYIDDAVHGILRTIENRTKTTGETFNIAYGEGTTILALAETVKKLTGSTSEIRMGEPRTGEVIRYIADISKAKQVVGYAPKTPFSEGIKKAVEWYKANT